MNLIALSRNQYMEQELARVTNQTNKSADAIRVKANAEKQLAETQKKMQGMETTEYYYLKNSWIKLRETELMLILILNS